MNVLFITADLKEAESIKTELEKSIPAFNLETAPAIKAALSHISTPGMIDIILLDTSVSMKETINLITGIKKEKKNIGVIVLTKDSENGLPADLLNSGAHSVIVKQPGYIASLADTFHQAKENPQESSATRSRRVRLLYVGDLEKARRYLSGVPQLVLEQASLGPDGLMQLPETKSLSSEIIVLDCAVTGANTLNILKDTKQRVPEIPIILLTDPGNDEISVHGLRAGAADCVTKAGNYFLRLLLTLQKEIGRRELIRERATLKSREKRLRYIVESMPVGVIVMTAEGIVEAVNQVGLKIIGAVRMEQLLGKNFTSLIPKSDREKVLSFLEEVCGGTGASIPVKLAGQNEQAPGIELRAVPMQKDDSGAVSALVVLDRRLNDQDLMNSGGQDSAGNKQVYEKKLLEIQKRFTSQEANWEKAIKQSEEQIDAFKNAADEAEARHQILLGEHQSERENWEQARREYKEQCIKIEEVAESLKSAQKNLMESHNSEKLKWEDERRELEQKLLDIEEQLMSAHSNKKSTDSGLAQLSETHSTELHERNQLIKGLELKCKAIEEQALSLQSALKESESDRAQATERYSTELSQRDLLYQKLEQKLKTIEGQAVDLQSLRQNSESGLAEMAEAHNAEISRRDLLQKDLEQKCDATEKQITSLQAVLQNSESSLKQMTEAHNAELARRDLIQKEFEQKCIAAEKQLASLQSIRQSSESSLKQMSDAHSVELARIEAAHKGSEQKCKAAEDQAAAMKSALQSSESGFKQIIEAHNADIAQRDLAQKKLAQKCRTTEDQVLALQASLRNSESGVAQLSEAHKAEISKREFAQKKLEQKCRVAEDQAQSLQTALQNAEAGLAKKSETHTAETAKRTQAYKELDEKYRTADEQITSLQAALQNAEAGLARRAETYTAENAKYELAYKELDEKCKAAEDQTLALQAALQTSKSGLSQIIESHNAAIAQRDLTHKKLEEKCNAIEEQALSLKAALQNTEANTKQIAEEHSAELLRRDLAFKEVSEKYESLLAASNETAANLAGQNESYKTSRAQWELDRQELEQALKNLEEQRDTLNISSESTEARFAQLNEEFRLERAQWEQSRQEYEQKYLLAEEQHATTLQNITGEMESRISHLSEEYRTATEQLNKTQQDLEQFRSNSTDLEVRYKRLSQFAAAGVVLSTKDGQVLQCNDAAARMFGYSDAAEALAQASGNPFRIFAFEGSLLSRLMQEGKLQSIEWSSLDRNGKVVSFHENASVVESDKHEGPLFERILTDISKIHSLTEEIRRSRRMESTGDIASATIKSMKDLCASLVHTGETLMEAQEASDEVRKLAESMLLDANRGIKHARQFASMASKAERVSVLLNLNEILSGNDTLIRNLMGEDIELHITISPKMGLISADRQELIQALSHLVASSREVLPLGGTVNIETANIEIDSPTSQLPTVIQPGIYIQLTIAADGCTVQPERRTVSIKQIVERMGGILETIHTPLLGNVYKVYWPRIEPLPGEIDLLSHAAGA